MEVINLFRILLLGLVLDFDIINTATTSIQIIRDIPIQTDNCSFFRPDLKIPCYQYTVSGSGCDETRLAQQWPQLYTGQDSNSPNWPRDPGSDHVTIDQSKHGVQWNVTIGGRIEGDIHFLRGFQVMLVGNQMATAGIIVCAVIDLPNVTLNMNTNLWKETIFVAKFEKLDVGEYAYTVRSLPLPAKGEPTPPMNIPNELPAFDYHPSLTVKINYKQTNVSCINVTIDFQPEVEEVNEIVLKAVKDTKERSDSISTKEMFNLIDDLIINYKEIHNPHLLCGFSTGNYNLKITPYPKEKYNMYNLNTCMCFYGTNDSRQCTSCHTYTRSIHVAQHGDVSAPTEETHVVEIVVGTCVGIVTLVAALTLIWLLGYKKIHRQCRYWRKGHFGDLVDICHTSRVLGLVYACDHDRHVQAVMSLAELIKAVTGNDVVLLNQTKDNLVTKDNMLSTIDNFFKDSASYESAMVCLIHSKWSHHLFKNYHSEKRSPSDLSNKDRRFLTAINKLVENRKHVQILPARFSYTPETFAINELFPETMFTFPLDIQSFIARVKTASENDSYTCNTVIKGLTESLSYAIKASVEFQETNKHWFEKKLNHLNSVSSEDSGIHNSRRNIYRSRSYRSRSVDTVFCETCTTVVQNRQHCGTCTTYTRSHKRTHSWDLSFAPPEAEVDELSVGDSLLERNFREMNERYEFIVNYKAISDDDCITMYGKSV